MTRQKQHSLRCINLYRSLLLLLLLLLLSLSVSGSVRSAKCCFQHFLILPDSGTDLKNNTDLKIDQWIQGEKKLK